MLTAYEVHQLKSGSFHVVDKDEGFEGKRYLLFYLTY